MRRDTSAALRAGDLKHTLQIIAPAGTVAEGDVTIQDGVPAAITPVPVAFQSKEHLAIGGVQASTVYVVSVRYRTDLVSSYVVVEECCTMRRFQIQAIVPSDRKDAIDMTCVTAG